MSVRNQILILCYFLSFFLEEIITFYYPSDKQICPYTQTTNFNSVKYVYICGIKVNHNDNHYFPNAIEHCFQTFDNSLTEILDRIIPLNKIIKIIFKNFDLSFQQSTEIL
jgi:hypothetical protein